MVLPQVKLRFEMILFQFYWYIYRCRWSFIPVAGAINIYLFFTSSVYSHWYRPKSCEDDTEMQWHWNTMTYFSSNVLFTCLFLVLSYRLSPFMRRKTFKSWMYKFTRLQITFTIIIIIIIFVEQSGKTQHPNTHTLNNNCQCLELMQYMFQCLAVTCLIATRYNLVMVKLICAHPIRYITYCFTSTSITFSVQITLYQLLFK
jgi:hypothetical protein